jgi:hypothetical protein
VLRLHEVLAMRANIYLVMELATDDDLLSRLAALPLRRLVFVQLGARRSPAGSSATPARRRTRRTSTAAGISSLLRLRTMVLAFSTMPQLAMRRDANRKMEDWGVERRIRRGHVGPMSREGE